MIIRRTVEEDAAAFVHFANQLDTETKFMMFEPGERDVSVEDQARIFRRTQDSAETIYLIAIEGDTIVGFIAGIGSSVKRISHRLMVVIGILEEYQGQGIGTQLFTQLEQWANEQGKQRLELTVMTHNELGLSLYKKRGFEIEGTKRHSLVVDGKSIDEFYMAKIIGVQ
ncbi:GNAT family N-acetyltransferase [Paenibacillus albiflavus]|uniref:GNAT family N-acetyltransferase n=1 Tax=Paenibacillus albiflavus TaxID=2545760 RepID=A0A4R4EGP1_9BACL|nr:GNAT family N-acetyltransferase [Paenibacillus albiflavus]TCZ79254.1 GNAT family N-acetyltransferase [Paenibacillus albiflavus]